jgi:hypothetical protein
MDKGEWAEIDQERDLLCKMHDTYIADYEKCMEFANRVSLFISLMGDLDLNSMVNMAMDIQTYLQPHGSIPLRENQHG